MREYLRLLGRECEDELRQELEARIREHHQEEPEPFTIQLAEDLMLMDSGRAIGTYYELVAEGGEYYLTGTSEISIPGKELLDDNWLLRVGEEIDARASGEG